MGKKSVAQMSEREKKRHSLAAKTVGRIILSSFLLGAVALLIGLLIYGSNLFRQSIDRACKTARLAVASATNAADSVGLSKEIMGIYRGLTPEQRSLMESDAEADRETYRGFYTVLDSVTRKGGAYDVLRHMLRGYKNDVDYVYLAMYDEETSAMVYIADSDQVDPLAPGEWEKVDRDQMMRFLNWDGEGDLYAIGNTEKYGWLCTAGCPIRDQNGEICEFLLVDVSIGSVAAKLTQYALQIGVALLAATALIAWLMARRMKKSVAEPIDAIAGAAVAYVRDKQSGADNSDHFSSP